MGASEKDLRQLSVAQRLQLIDSLWTSLSPELESTPLLTSHAEELDRRLLDKEKRPHDVVEWSEVEAMLVAGMK